MGRKKLIAIIYMTSKISGNNKKTNILSPTKYIVKLESSTF